MSNTGTVEPIYNPFHFTTPISDFEFNIAEPFSKKFVFTYDGGGDTIIAKLSGNPKTTGVKIDSIVNVQDGTYYIIFSGTPRVINKNDLILTMRDNRNNIIKFPITYTVNPVRIDPAYLPDAVGLFIPHTAKIFFKFPESTTVNIVPKFSYNFPIEFGAVKTLEVGENFTTIIFSPSKVGKYKFLISALSPDNILLGHRTMHVAVYTKGKVADKKAELEREKEIEKATESLKVEAVHFKEWRN